MENLENIEKVDPNTQCVGTDRKNAKNKPGPGGKRVGAGRKKGQKNLKTVLKEEAAKEIAEKNMLKAEIIKALPPNLQRSERALKEAIKEINEEEIEEVFKKRIALHSNQLLTAMLSAALGQQFLYKVVETIDEKGKLRQKHVQVTDPEEIQMYLDNPLEGNGRDYFYITEKQPDINAVNSLLDRFMGRPTTKVVGASNPDGSEGPIKVVVANFSAPAPQQAQNAGQIAGDIVQHVIEEQNGN
jgi:hypothetical protein